jgi:hypothetical protein
MKRPKRSTLFLGVAVVAALLAIPGGSFFYESNGGESCARCHELRPTFALWRASTHRETNCKACHGGTLTLDMDFHLGNIRRLIKHWKDDAPNRFASERGRGPADETVPREPPAGFAIWEAGRTASWSL